MQSNLHVLFDSTNIPHFFHILFSDNEKGTTEMKTNNWIKFQNGIRFNVRYLVCNKLGNMARVRKQNNTFTNWMVNNNMMIRIKTEFLSHSTFFASALGIGLTVGSQKRFLAWNYYIPNLTQPCRKQKKIGVP